MMLVMTPGLECRPCAQLGVCSVCVSVGLCVCMLPVHGYTSLGKRLTSVVERYDPSSDTWSDVAPMSYARGRHAAYC